MRSLSAISTLTFLFFLLPSCGSDAPLPGGGAGGGSSSSSSGGQVGATCKVDADCAKGQYCSIVSDGECAAPPTRTCEIYPASCGEGTVRTVCGCDGKSHALGSCPSANPVDIDKRDGSCPPAAGTFWCGESPCNVGAQYCSEGLTGTTCMDMPAACMAAQANCACLDTMGVKGCGCLDEVGGGIRITECSL